MFVPQSTPRVFSLSRSLSALMGVGGNVVKAASKAVLKDANSDPEAIVQVTLHLIVSECSRTLGSVQDLESDLKETQSEETDDKAMFAPSQFYDACDDCDTLPEERWEIYREKMIDQKRTVVEGREKVGVFLLQLLSRVFSLR